MNWLINFSSPKLISWCIDDWGHSNEFKYALNDELENFPWFYLNMGWGCFKSKAQLIHGWIRVSLGHKPQTLWFALIKMMNWDTWEEYLMDESFWEPFPCLLSSSLGHINAHRISLKLLTLWFLKLQTRDVRDIFLWFWLVNKIRKTMIYNSNMLGDLKPTHKRSHPKANGS